MNDIGAPHRARELGQQHRREEVRAAPKAAVIDDAHAEAVVEAPLWQRQPTWAIGVGRADLYLVAELSLAARQVEHSWDGTAVARRRVEVRHHVEDSHANDARALSSRSATTV